MEYLNCPNSGYDFYFVEVDTPDGTDIEQRIENSDNFIKERIGIGISRGSRVSKKFNDDVEMQICSKIIDVLNSHAATIYELSMEGWDKYGAFDDFWDNLQALIHLQGEIEHWYTFWTFWSD